MLSPAARYATYIVALLFALLGAALFVAPGWSADHFAWRVSNFLAMTMGAWYLGTGVFAWMAARDRRWSVVYGVLAYLWLFSLGQAALLVIHDEILDTGATLAWPYIVVVGAAAAAALLGVVEAVRRRPTRDREAEGMPWWMRVIVGAFVVAVAALAVPLVDGYDSPQSIWPGELTLISARAFAVFFGSLSVSAALLLLAGAVQPLVTYLRAGILLNAVILLAAVVYLGEFDFGDHPGQFLYVGLYAVVLVGTAAMLAYAARRPIQ